jgi:hypothetical protein
MRSSTCAPNHHPLINPTWLLHYCLDAPKGRPCHLPRRSITYTSKGAMRRPNAPNTRPRTVIPNFGATVHDCKASPARLVVLGGFRRLGGRRRQLLLLLLGALHALHRLCFIALSRRCLRLGSRLGSRVLCPRLLRCLLHRLGASSAKFDNQGWRRALSKGPQEQPMGTAQSQFE